MKSIIQNNSFPFLQRGGEMGELARRFDWSKTAIGSPSQWPQSLRTTVSNLLLSRFPMFLWWGKEKIQFYNDAYRPSLGNSGKHPMALGQNGQDCWPEIWEIIYPLMQQVEETGEAIWMEDQLVPIYRNEKLEDVYWTFSYSAVLNDEGNHGGILVTCSETTDKIQTIKQLQLSEQRFQNLIHEATVGIIVLRGEASVVDVVNDFYARLIDRTTGQLSGKPLFDVIPEAKPHFNPIIENVRTTGTPVYLYDHPYFVVNDGVKKEGFLNLVYQPYKEQDGTITGVMVLCQDVSQQVQSRKKMEEAEERARLSVEAGALGTFDVDLLTATVITSAQFDAIFSVEASVNHTDYISTVFKEDLPVREVAYKRAFENGMLEYEARVQWKDGSLHWVRVKGKVLFDSHKVPVKLLGVAQDITEEKAFFEELERQVKNRTEELEQAQLSLLRSNDYLQAIINKFETALVSLTPVIENGKVIDFRFKMTNEAYSIYSHLAPSQIAGRTVTSVFPEYKKTAAFEKYLETYITGNPNNWELHYNVDKLDIYLIVSASKMGDEVVVHWNDITLLKNLQLDLLQKVEELQRSNRNLEEFAYAASHDLKEPIRKIHFFNDRIKTSLYEKFSIEDTRSFERLETAAKRMSSLIDDLLSYSQVSLFPKAAEEVNLNALVELVLNDLDVEIEERKAIVTVDELCTVTGHHRQLQQAFQNLIVNALKYSRANVPPAIHISCTKFLAAESPHSILLADNRKTFYAIAVSDNGIGFEQAEAERIFNIFTRLHSNSEYLGTGIGLSIVRKVVENHQGYITANGTVNTGATFTVYLPAD